ncbi:MAG TPA: hypothetical protein VHY08_20210 [Bacillota bacterium]|nr:hypothetical protein [Bacillota bacterium]
MHGGYWHGFRGGGIFTVWPLLIFGVLLLAIILVVVLVSQHRNRINLTELTDTQRATMENIEAQVMALLAQYGGAMTQIEIRNHLNLPNDLVAKQLLEMEQAGYIKREWVQNDYTFRVNPVS